jgi:hypothetical protein
MANVFPSWENTALPGWRVAVSRLVATSHSLVESLPPEAKTVPSGENATETTSPFCRSVAGSCAGTTFHSLTAQSTPLAEATVLPSGENATHPTRLWCG